MRVVVRLNWQLWFAGMAAYIIEVLQIKSLNHMVEQSHRAVKWQGLKPR
ncbi:hypothetical protein [Shewanella sp. YLB-07]|nr:hypothetical protein [Shewanella sp. YLB-07]